MKKRIFGALFLALVGVGFVSCEKESLVENNETSQNPTGEAQQNLNKANVHYYALGAENIDGQLFRKQYDLFTGLFSSASSPDYGFHSVGAYNYDLVGIEKTGTNSCSLFYDGGLLMQKTGVVKYLGADILMDEVELLDDDINKIYALRGHKIYKLTYNNSTTNFDATLVYTYPGTAISVALRRYTIAQVIGNQNFIRLYTAANVMSPQGQPAAMTTLSYIDMNPTNGLIASPVNATTPVPGSGNLSSFTSKDFMNATPISSDYFVVVDKTIYQFSTPTTFFVTSGFTATVRDCAFYLR